MTLDIFGGDCLGLRLRDIVALAFIVDRFYTRGERRTTSHIGQSVSAFKRCIQQVRKCAHNVIPVRFCVMNSKPVRRVRGVKSALHETFPVPTNTEPVALEMGSALLSLHVAMWRRIPEKTSTVPHFSGSRLATN
jgi:hypothetical protein